MFKALCQGQASAPPARKLPAYSFIEPRFVMELGLFKIDYPSDYHPPHDVGRGEIFLADVYQAVRNSPYRDKILLVITFDEHGGCYDHVPPPAGAAPPDPSGTVAAGSFDFTRFGVRVPAIVVSSYVRPGTVFRASAGEAPYDHTSILATLRDWLNLASDPVHPFLTSRRIAPAPTLDRVLTEGESTKISNWPSIVAQATVGDDDTSFATPLNDVQKSLLAVALKMHTAQAMPPAAPTPVPPVIGASPAAAMQAKSLKTYEDAFRFLHRDTP
jgi:phospholipase C